MIRKFSFFPLHLPLIPSRFHLFVYALLLCSLAVDAAVHLSLDQIARLHWRDSSSREVSPLPLHLFPLDFFPLIISPNPFDPRVPHLGSHLARESAILITSLNSPLSILYHPKIIAFGITAIGITILENIYLQQGLTALSELSHRFELDLAYSENGLVGQDAPLVHCQFCFLFSSFKPDD